MLKAIGSKTDLEDSEKNSYYSLVADLLDEKIHPPRQYYLFSALS